MFSFLIYSFTWDWSYQGLPFSFCLTIWVLWRYATAFHVMNMGDDCGAFYDSRINFNKTYNPNQRSPVASLLTELHRSQESRGFSRCRSDSRCSPDIIGTPLDVMLLQWDQTRDTRSWCHFWKRTQHIILIKFISLINYCWSRTDVAFFHLSPV